MDFDKALIDEFNEFTFERPVSSYKSPEEIERLSVDERLSDIERAVYLLSSGQDVQRISVVNNLTSLLEDHHDECMRRVVPKVREVLHVSEQEMQLAACTAFLQILRNDLIPLSSYSQTFLQTILGAIDSRDQDSANAWLETLLDVIELLPKEILKKEILGVAVAKGQLSESVQSRLSCCQILGKLATRFESFVIKKDILPVVQSLCQDVDYEVRGCMCLQLDSVARGLGLEATKSAVLPELVELTSDEESRVRLAGLETVVNILSLLDEETCTETIVPLVIKFYHKAMKDEDQTLPAVAKNIGKLCHSLCKYLEDDDKRWFVDYYRKLCQYNGDSSKKRYQSDSHRSSISSEHQAFNINAAEDPLETSDPYVKCRRNAAYNMPAMALFCGPRYFRGELSSVFTLLCKDSNHHVRKCVAGGFHEVIKLLGSYGHCVLQDFVQLLRDDHIQVLNSLVPNLPNSLQMILDAVSHLASEPREIGEILPAMIDCEAVISYSNDWRLQADVLESFSHLHHCFPSDILYQKMVPLMFRKLHFARALPVKQAASHTLLTLLRKNRRLNHRECICDKLISDFGEGRSFYHRTLFITICHQIMKQFSRSFFKTHMFEAVINLTADPVPNIRLRVCPLLPKLKAALKLPSDRNLLQQLETGVRKMMLAEKDRDVCTAIQRAIDELEKTTVVIDSLPNKNMREDDLEDRRKEEEEILLIEQEEQERRDEDHLKSKNDRKRDKDKKDRDVSSGASKPIKKGLTKIPTPTSSSVKDRGRGSASSTSSNPSSGRPPTEKVPTGKTSRLKREGTQIGNKPPRPVSGTTSSTLTKKKSLPRS